MSQIKIGTVISDKMKNAVVVKITTKIKHPLYKKQMSHSKNFKAQNLVNAKTGDQVKIIETKPVAKTIHFKVLEILKGEK